MLPTANSPIPNLDGLLWLERGSWGHVHCWHGAVRPNVVSFGAYGAYRNCCACGRFEESILIPVAAGLHGCYSSTAPLVWSAWYKPSSP